MEATAFRPVLRDAMLLLAAAIALGAIHNASSPLGVRMAGAEMTTGSTANAGRSVYSNETIAMTPPSQHPAATGGSRVQNDTVSISIQGRPAVLNAAPLKNVPEMTWPEVQAMGDKITLVDAREPTAFDAGHVPNAISLPTRLVNEKISQFLADVPRNKTVVVYCANPQCPLSRNLSRVLIDQYGYTDVRNVPGGYVEWLVNQSRQ